MLRIPTTADCGIGIARRALLALAICCIAACAEPVADESFSEFFGKPVELGELSSRWQQEAQELTGLCMREQGFDYTIVANAETQLSEDRSVMDEADFVAQHGYGLAASVLDALRSVATDPNLEYMASIPDLAEQTAYMNALVGPVLAAGSVEDEMPPLDRQGCTGAAVLDLGSASLISDLDRLSAEYQSQLDRLRSDPEVVAGAKDWSRCMAELGYDFGEQVDARNLVTQDLRAFFIPLIAEFASTTDDPGNFYGSVEAFESLSGFDALGWESLQEQERMIATADLTCYDQHLAAVWVERAEMVQRRLIGSNLELFVEARELVN